MYLNFKWIILCNTHKLTHECKFIVCLCLRVFSCDCVCGVYNKNNNNNNNKSSNNINCARINDNRQGSLFEQSQSLTSTHRGTQRHSGLRARDESSLLFCALLPPGMRCSPTKTTAAGTTTAGDRDEHTLAYTFTHRYRWSGEETLFNCLQEAETSSLGLWFCWFVSLWCECIWANT